MSEKRVLRLVSGEPFDFTASDHDSAYLSEMLNTALEPGLNKFIPFFFFFNFRSAKLFRMYWGEKRTISSVIKGNQYFPFQL